MNQSTETQKKTYSKLETIWFFLKPKRIQVGMLMVLFILAGSLEAATIAAIYPILNAAFSSASSSSNYILDGFEKIATWIPINDLFVSYCVVFVAFTVFAFIVKYIAIKNRVNFIAGLVTGKQKEIYNKFVRADYQYFSEHKQGELFYVTTTAPQNLSNLILAISELISQIILSITVFVLLFSLSLPGAIGVLFLGLGYVFLSRFLGSRISYKAGVNEVRASQQSNVVFNESINGIKQVKVFATEGVWISRFSKAVEQRWNNFIRRSIWQQVLPNILLFVLYLAVAVVVLIIKFFNPIGYMALIPIFGAFAFAVFRLIPFVSAIGGTIMTIQTSLPDCEIMRQVLNEELTGIADGQLVFDSFKRSISFKDVSFAYSDRRKTVVDFSAVFERGKTTAIVGRSGSGKSTIIGLILRLFDVSKGEIMIDDHNLSSYHLESWLKNVGYVSQDTFILNDTIAANITFGSDEYTQDQIIEAAKWADAHAFITELPQGYETHVGDKGMKLSGGQAQRIAVARAMIRNPEILIFDEATNNLDNISELAVQKAIEEISKNHTVILVAHRLSTIEGADKILLLDKGTVQEQGTHQELMELNGSYWKLHQRQIG